MSEVDEILHALVEADDDEVDLHKEIDGSPGYNQDFLIDHLGGLVLVWPQNEKAQSWLKETSPEGADFIAEALMVEPRYIEGIIDSIVRGGFTWRQYSRTQSESICEDEEDDDETIKGIMGGDYLDIPAERTELSGDIERFDRWADVRIGGDHFCISYLTPVAVYTEGGGAKITDRDWSSATKRHIVRWLNHIRLGPADGYRKYKEVAERYKTIPQDELIKLFKHQASRVRWNKRQAKLSTRLPYGKMPFMKSGSEDRVALSTHDFQGMQESEEEELDAPLKDITEPEEIYGGKTTVKRYGRMKVVDTPRYTFLISYLTPVAYHDKVFDTYYESTKHWSPTTNDHISRWSSLIHKTPQWQNNPKNKVKSEVSDFEYVGSPKFKKRTQEAITALFRQLMPKMIMKPHEKRRMYHVDPRMRSGSGIDKRWISGHLKHHDTGDEGMPRPDDPGFEEFFKDFEADEPEMWEWGSDYKNLQPYERYEPDES